MKRKIIIILITIFFGGIVYFIKYFSEYSTHKHSIELNNRIDPKIVLINIGEGDRAYIGDLLLSIDSCKPLVIGVDAVFLNNSDSTQDSVLINALKSINKDILSYRLDSSGKPLKSLKKFSSNAMKEGVAVTKISNGLSNSFVPIQTIDGKPEEHFALQIVRQMQPGFKWNEKVDKLIPIKFIRSLDQFFHFEGSKIKNIEKDSLKDKVILVGYLGPSNEDKYFTPLRFVNKFPDDEPDTYGLVIIANEIRTILSYPSNVSD